MLLRTAALACLLAGCPEPSDLPACATPGPEAQIVMADDAGQLSDVGDGSQVPLFRAPQGGQIMLIGARLRGPGQCQIQATAALRDPVSQRVIGLDQRPLLLAPRSDGWLVPIDPSGLSSMPNLAACPSAAATSQVDGTVATIEVTLAGLAAPLTARITPTCGGDDYCHMDCAPPVP